MLLQIRNRLEKELKAFARDLDKNYHLKELSPLISRNIKEFILREGKRIRPMLFCIGYLGFAQKAPPGLFRCAISLELLHDFMLIHDDIIDKSDMRRGKPSMHIVLQRQLPNKGLKFDGKDLAIVIGDVIYALALDYFLSIKADAARKELGLKKLISAALYTGSGEFIELILGARPIEQVSKKDIYKIYTLKTANYTFCTPLTMGAVLAGANQIQLKNLFEYGRHLGIAFQIKDDLIGIFGKSSDTGKSNLTDIKEAKKTLLIWHAYRNSSIQDQKTIKNILARNQVEEKELQKIQEIILKTKSVDFANREINRLTKKADELLKNSGINIKYQKALKELTAKILATSL